MKSKSKMMNEVIKDNVSVMLRTETKQKLINCANKACLSPDALLNALLDDEVERQRLLGISEEISQEKPSQAAPSQKIAKICNTHLSTLDHNSESVDIRSAIESLHASLLRANLISVNAREGGIVESKRVKTSRVAYYWYAGALAKYTAMWFGTFNVYLYHELLSPFSESVFVGMPANVEVCYQVFSHLYQLFNKTKSVYKKDSGDWGSKREMEDIANRYMSEFVQELQRTQAFIENDDYGKPLYDYAQEKYAWAMR